MSVTKLHQRNRLKAKNKQAGLVLFIALISLVVMSLAAVALIRSVDTNSQITGNLAFRQNATLSSGYGLEAVAQTVGKQLIGYETADHAANGYYATCLTFDKAASNNPCNGETLTEDAKWVPGTTSSYGDALPGVTGGKDAYGNTVQYIVERMCNVTGTAVQEKCLLTSATLDAGSHQTPTSGGTTSLASEAIDQPIYRITVRTAGPKNTVSYVQSFFS